MEIKIITLIGSTKFEDEFRRIESYLTMLGHVVFTPGYFIQSDNESSDDVKKLINETMIKKIILSYAVIVLDVNNYIDKPTSEYIRMAKDMGKGVYYYSNSDLLKIVTIK